MPAFKIAAARFSGLALGALLFGALLLGAAGARAQGSEPQPPAPIQALVAEGAQIRYLGRAHGLDGWLTIQRGKEQYFYVTQDGEAMLMGLLFDKSGKLVTVEQVKALRGAEGNDILDMLADEGAGEEAAAPGGVTPVQPEFKSPSERMFADIEGSNWVTLGSKDAPVLYVIIDPQCPHCHEYLKDLRKDYIEAGKLQVRLIPVGFREETIAQSAFLLAAPDPQALWFRHLDGDEGALPARQGLNEQGVQMNLAVMQSWKFDVTPVTIYRAKDGKVKILRGRASDAAALLADLR